MFLRTVEILFAIIVAIIIVTQVAMPAWKHQKLFPIFRKSQKQLEKELAEAEQKKSEVELRADIDDVRKESELEETYRKERRNKWM